MARKKVNVKVIAFYVIAIAAICGLFALLAPQIKKEMSRSNSSQDNNTVTSTTSDGSSSSDVVKISLDEWIGWKPLIDANQGLTTAKGSINDQLGINVEYVITNDANVSSAALIKGDLQGAGYTINRYAFLQNKFNEANLAVCMPYISNYSNGGDGIIAKSSIKSVNDLAGKKIAVPRYSEAQTLVEWLINNSDMSADTQKSIRESMVYFETPDDAAKAFFSGQVDAAATWEPYLTQAKGTTDCRVLFDTSMSNNLILDGVLFRQDFLDANEDFVTKLIDGALQAKDMYKTEFKYIKVMPMFELMSDEEIIETANGADIASWKDNKSLLNDQAKTMYKDMANIWLTIGENAFPNAADSAFTDKYIAALESKYSSISEERKTGEFTQENKEQAKATDNREALMSKRLDIKFQPDSVVISEESYPALNEFADIAKILDGVFIQIEGNTAKVPDSDGKAFSEKRANSIAKYLQAQGVDASRFIIVGNGDSNPIGDNNTEEGKAANRRTDIFFKIVGY